MRGLGLEDDSPDLQGIGWAAPERVRKGYQSGLSTSAYYRLHGACD